MRRVSLAIAVTGLTLMACCCGGFGENPPPNQQAVAENANEGNPANKVTTQPGVEVKPTKPTGKTAVKDPLGIAQQEPRTTSYDVFPEPHRTDLLKEWKVEIAEVKAMIVSSRTSLDAATTSAEREKYSTHLEIYTGRLTRLQKNKPPYVTEAAAKYAANLRETTDLKEIADARQKRKKQAETEAQVKNEELRKAHEAEVERLTNIFNAKKKQYAIDKAAYGKAAKAYEQATAEYEAAREMKLARLFYDDSTKDPKIANRRFQKIIEDYPGTQAAADAKVLLSGKFLSARKMLAEPVSPVVPRSPMLKLPVLTLVDVVYPLDPVSEAIAEVARQSTLAGKAEANAISAANAKALRRAGEEFEINGLVLLNNTLKGTIRDFSSEITGTVVNYRGKTLKYVQITFSLYDDSGALVGTALANVNNLEDEGRWSFRAVSLNTRWQTFKCTGLTGF